MGTQQTSGESLSCELKDKTKSNVEMEANKVVVVELQAASTRTKGKPPRVPFPTKMVKLPNLSQLLRYKF